MGCSSSILVGNMHLSAFCGSDKGKDWISLREIGKEKSGSDKDI